MLEWYTIVLCGTPIWQGLLTVKRNRHLVEKTQRKVLIRVAAACRTAFSVALQVITGIPLLAQERKYIYERGKPPVSESKRENGQEN